MNIKTSLLALALAAVAMPAFANGDDDTEFNNDIDLSTDVSTAGGMAVLGLITPSSQSSASVDQDQSTGGQLSLGDGDHSADLEGNALLGASGNIGVNVGAGVGNVQANDTSLAAIDSSLVFASATITSYQESGFNLGGSLSPDTFYSANASGSALAGATGNIGLNVAGGVGNGQGNAMAASINSSGELAIASSDSEQISIGNTLLALIDVDTFAVLGGNTLAGATGNIGANIAAGIGNLQHNGLTIASGGQ